MSHASPAGKLAAALVFAAVLAAPAGAAPQLQRIRHDPSILPDAGNSAFGSLLFDVRGRLVLHGGRKTWLYTSAVIEPPSGARRDWYGRWITHARELDVGTLASGDKQVALSVAGDEQWAIIHDVIEVSGDLFVALYSSFGGVRAAVSAHPQGPFERVPDFEIGVTDEWEKSGGTPQSLEANGAHVLAGQDAATVTLWVGYDSYHVDRGSGQLGWAKVLIDKRARAVRFLGKHPGNPLALEPEGYLAARCGGNLASDVRLGGRHTFLYYTRPDRARSFLTVALATDPLFQHVTQRFELEPTLGEEKVAEKFESYVFDGLLHVIYESQVASGHWGTGMRIYRLGR